MSLENHFAEAPTVGSHTPAATVEELQAEVDLLNHRIAKLEARSEEARQKRMEERKNKKKIRWGKVSKFFTIVVTPILIFIPRLFNSLARYKKAVCT